MTGRWKITLALVVASALSLPSLPVLGIIGWEIIQGRRHRRSFDANSWRGDGSRKEGQRWPPRLRMVDDLIARGLLPRRTEAQVIELLGPPTSKMVLPGKSAFEVSYYLGPERGSLFGMDSETLCIEIGAEGKATRQWIHRD